MKRYFQFTQYIYIIFAGIFIYDGIIKFQEDDANYKVMFFIAAIAIFMFFFRMRFNKKILNNNQKQK